MLLDEKIKKLDEVSGILQAICSSSNALYDPVIYGWYLFNCNAENQAWKAAVSWYYRPRNIDDAVFLVVDVEMLCRNMRWSIYLLTVTMLFMVNILGTVSGGAARWLEIGGFRFQPSEVGKLLLILFFSERFSEKAEKVSQWGFLLRTTFLMGIPLISILEEPDLSTTIVTDWIFICVWFVAGYSYKLIGKFLAVIIPAGALFLFLVTRPGQELLNHYQYRRIMAWLNPEEWAARSYQQMYSMMAIGSGGALGRLGEQDEAVTVIGSGFLPEPHTDFIMVAAGQEWGIPGDPV